MARMLKDGFTDTEIEEAKSGLLQASKVSRSQDGELSGTLNANLFLDRTMKWSKEYEAQLQDLSAKEVQDVMNRYFKVQNFSYIFGGDLSKIH
jgi:zinc protease